jgi:hypothetical protein
MNVRILIGLSAVTLTLTLITGSAYALFASQATATNNSFTTATADLKIAPDSNGTTGTLATSMTGFTPSSPIVPGYSQDFKFWLVNQSTNNLGLATVAKLATNGTVNDTGLQAALMLTFTCTNTSTAVVTTAGPYSVTTWLASSSSIGSLASGQKANCVMHVTLASDAASTLQGKTVSFDAQFTGTQQ